MAETKSRPGPTLHSKITPSRQLRFQSSIADTMGRSDSGALDRLTERTLFTISVHCQSQFGSVGISPAPDDWCRRAAEHGVEFRGRIRRWPHGHLNVPKNRNVFHRRTFRGIKIGGARHEKHLAAGGKSRRGFAPIVCHQNVGRSVRVHLRRYNQKFQSFSKVGRASAPVSIYFPSWRQAGSLSYANDELVLRRRWKFRQIGRDFAEWNIFSDGKCRAFPTCRWRRFCQTSSHLPLRRGIRDGPFAEVINFHIRFESLIAGENAAGEGVPAEQSGRRSGDIPPPSHTFRLPERIHDADERGCPGRDNRANQAAQNQKGRACAGWLRCLLVTLNLKTAGRLGESLVLVQHAFLFGDILKMS